MNKLLAKLLLLLILFSKVYLEEIFIGEINIYGLKSFKENILFMKGLRKFGYSAKSVIIKNKLKFKKLLIIGINHCRKILQDLSR